MDPTDFLKLLLAPDRLAVVGAIANRACDVDEIAARTGVERRVVLETVAALRDGGAVIETAGTYRLDPSLLVDLAQRLPQPAPPDRSVFHGMTDEEREVLGRFFRGERLTEIPASRVKRSVVLERLALEFEPGRRYTEREVNDILGRFHDDHASLRRYLVDGGLLAREPRHTDEGGTEMEYWRAGGRVFTTATSTDDEGERP